MSVRTERSFSPFNIYLLPNSEGTFDAKALLASILADGRVLPLSDDPWSCLYRNADTSVHFHLRLAPEVMSLWRHGTAVVDDSDGSHREEAEEEQEEEDAAEELHEETDSGDGSEGIDDEAGSSFEAPPAVITLPILCPTFFAREAFALAGRMAEAAELHLDVPIGEAENAAWLSASMAPDILEAVIVRAWVSFNRRLVVELDDPASVTAWSPEKADAWWNYGLGRARLEAELAKDGVHVPILQGAFHEGRVKSLAAWKVGTAVALPRTDLVLVQREVEQKGFFRTRKVLVEGLLTGEETWDLLAPFSEVRREPAEIVIFRAGATAAAEVAARIERLSLEPVESARRTSLVREQLIFSYSRFPGSGWERIDGGVIDFEPSGSEEE